MNTAAAPSPSTVAYDQILADVAQEIIHQIPEGSVGLAVLDHDVRTDVWLNHAGQVLVFSWDTTGSFTQDGLSSFKLTDLAIILDSFADPDSGAVVKASALTADNAQLPDYFQNRLANEPTLAASIKDRLGL